MRVIIYADFNCPYCYLASQRADRLIAGGLAEVDWRAVEHDQSLASTGRPAPGEQADWERELAEVAALAWPGDQVPSAPPATRSTAAAVAAYAEAVSDGVQDEMRRRMYRAIWSEGQDMSSAYAVRRVVASVLWPIPRADPRLASPDLPDTLDQDPHLTMIVRRSGGTIAPDGGPLTTVGYRRIRQWRDEWLALPSQVIPAVLDDERVLRSGTAGLRYLARLAAADGVGSAAALAGGPGAELPVRTA